MNDPSRLWLEVSIVVFIDRVHDESVLLIELDSRLVCRPDVELELPHIAQVLEVLDHLVQEHSTNAESSVRLKDSDCHEVHSVHTGLVLGLISAQNTAAQDVGPIIGKNAQVLSVGTEDVLFNKIMIIS